LWKGPAVRRSLERDGRAEAIGRALALRGIWCGEERGCCEDRP
jgi:hypothetical protein